MEPLLSGYLGWSQQSCKYKGFFYKELNLLFGK